jgi:ribonuclease BN (tRNA processing enzyme)
VLCATIDAHMQVLSPDVAGRRFVVTGPRPCHARIQEACGDSGVHIVLHETWHGAQGDLEHAGLCGARRAVEEAEKLGAHMLMLTPRATLLGGVLRGSLGAESAALVSEARAAAGPDLAIAAPVDLQMIVFRQVGMET